MANSRRISYSRSPSPQKELSRSRSRSRSRSMSRHRSRSRSRSFPRPRSRSRSRGRSRSRSRGRTETENPGNTLYVTGLSTRVTDRELEAHFSKEGKVASCFLVVEPRTRLSRGFAFVTMNSYEDADRCIKYLNQSVLEGRYITVERQSKDDEFIILNTARSVAQAYTAFSNDHDQLIIYCPTPTSIQLQLSTNQRTLSTTFSEGSYVAEKAPKNSHSRALSWVEKR